MEQSLFLKTVGHWRLASQLNFGGSASPQRPSDRSSFLPFLCLEMSPFVILKRMNLHSAMCRLKLRRVNFVSVHSFNSCIFLCKPDTQALGHCWDQWIWEEHRAQADASVVRPQRGCNIRQRPRYQNPQTRRPTREHSNIISRLHPFSVDGELDRGIPSCGLAADTLRCIIGQRKHRTWGPSKCTRRRQNPRGGATGWC